MNKWTWKENKKPGVSHAIMENDELVALVIAFAPTPGNMEEQGRTNARLIAAARELYEALQRIARGIEGGQSFSGTDCSEIARAALAKVEL